MMLRSCLCMKAIFLFVFYFSRFLLICDLFFFTRFKKKKKMEGCEKKKCLDRQNNTILLDVQYHPKNFFF